MLKAARRFGKFVLVWTVVSLVVLDSAWAGRRRWQHAAYNSGGMCYESCEPVCSGAPVECGCSAVSEGLPIESEAASPSDVPIAPPIPEEEDSPASAATSPPAPVTPPQEPATAATPAPPSAPASPPAATPRAPAATPRAPARSLIEEDDPFAPASPATAPAAKAPAARTAPPTIRPAAPPAAAPAAAPDDNDPFAPAPPARSAAPPAATTPARPAVNPAADPAADPFKISALSDLPLREWVDDTGYFRVRGQLIAILDGKVRILKESGRTTTVPMTRLSTADREYVEGFKALANGQGDAARGLAAASRIAD